MDDLILKLAKALFAVESRIRKDWSWEQEMAEHPEDEGYWLDSARATLEALKPSLRLIVDHAWSEANEDVSVPSTPWADRIIEAGLRGEKIGEARARWAAEKAARKDT